MGDMKELFARMLDTPVPPMTRSDELLANAHAAARRRRVLRTGSLAAVTAFLMTIAIALGTTLAGPGADRRSGVGASPETSEPATAAPSAMPVDPSRTICQLLEATYDPVSFCTRVEACPKFARNSERCEVVSGRERQRAEELRSVLIATVPVTYPAVVVLLADDHLSARVVSTRGGQVIRGAALLLRRGPDASYVIATVTVGAERPKEPCADSPPGIWWGSDDACKIVESRAGTAIRYAWTDSPGGAHWYYATHFRSGVAVTVMQGQETATSTAVLSEREMVELTAKLAVGG